MRGEIDDHDHDRPIIKKPRQLMKSAMTNLASSVHWIPPQACFNEDVRFASFFISERSSA